MTDHVTHETSAWLPIRTTVFSDEQCATLVDTGIRSFLRELPSALPMVFSEIAAVTVALHEPPHEIASYIARASSIHAPPLFQCVQVAATVTVKRRSHEIASGDPGLDKLIDSSDAAYYLGRAIDVALDLSELANPGCIWTVQGAVVVQDKILEQTSEKVFVSEFHPGAQFSSSWPPVTSLPLSAVIRWAKSIGMLNTPLAATRLQRTLAAYTNLVGLGLRNEGESLFRAMQGLEAFYCDGVGDLRRQLSEKSQLWLGPSNTTSNIVGQLYDLRSQYVHGAARLQYRHDLADPWEHDEKTMLRLSSGTGFATRLLVASLQKCIRDELADLAWSFSVHTEPHKCDD